MPRIAPVELNSTDPATAEVLGVVKKKMGRVPNLLATMAQSPAVAQAYLGMSGSLARGTLSPKLREQIALAVGQANRCDYCLAAHTAIGKHAGLTEHEVLAARRGMAEDERSRAGLAFARTLVEQRGHVHDSDVDAVRAAGFSDGEIGEIVAHVALNLFTNYFNHVAETEVDFPAAADLRDS